MMNATNSIQFAQILATTVVNAHPALLGTTVLTAGVALACFAGKCAYQMVQHFDGALLGDNPFPGLSGRELHNKLRLLQKVIDDLNRQGYTEQDGAEEVVARLKDPQAVADFETNETGRISVLARDMGFFTPVQGQGEGLFARLADRVDGYLALSRKGLFPQGENHFIEAYEERWTLWRVLKVASYATILLPALAVLYKGAYRWSHPRVFFVEPYQPPDPVGGLN